MTSRAETLAKQHQLHDDLAALVARYIEHYGSDLDGMAALGEELLKQAGDRQKQTSWSGLLTRLQQLSG